MTELKIYFEVRGQGRSFLRLSKKHPLFKNHLVGWEKKTITYSFEDETQGGIVSDIIKAVLGELKIDFKVLEDELQV